MSDQENSLRPARWVPSLYFAEGLPFVATATVSTIMYKRLGMPVEDVTRFTTLVLAPWTLKPLWGPLLEMFKTKKYFIVATQFVGGVAFGCLALSLHATDFVRYSLAFFTLIAFNSATHDIAADGLYINSLSEKQQAQYVGWQGAFYNIAKALAQGGLVWVAGKLEESVGIRPAWTAVMLIIGAALICLSLYHARVLPAGENAAPVKSTSEALGRVAKVVETFFEKRNIIWALAFILFYRFAEGFQAKVAPLFFLATRDEGGLGLTTKEVGFAYGTVGVAAFVVGSMVAGYFAADRGLRRALLLFCAVFNFPNIAYTFLAFTLPQNLYVISAAIAVEMFGYGFGFAGLLLYMMQQVAPGPYKMAHYAFATAMMNLGFMIPAGMSGQLSKFLGYRNFFIWVLFAAIPCFVVSWLVPIRSSAEIEATPVARPREAGLRKFLLYRAYVSILSIMGSLIFSQPKYQIINALLSSLWLASTAGMFQWRRWATFAYLVVTIGAIAAALGFGYGDYQAGALGETGFGGAIVVAILLVGELGVFARVIRRSWSEFDPAVAA
jgi:PAT family beta-lactamase induction signal transducer AmpG